MKDQHEKITGYRDLSQEEIDLMNEIKAAEAQVAALYHRVRGIIAAREITADTIDSRRQISIARTGFESAFMNMVRSVACPASPWVNSEFAEDSTAQGEPAMRLTRRNHTDDLTEFGVEMLKYMAAAHVNRADVAKATRVSAGHVGRLICVGRRWSSPSGCLTPRPI